MLADHYEGKRLNSPNDLVYKSDGALYFTDPPFGLPKFDGDPRKELPYSGVFRVSPDGKQIKLLTTDLKGPNGLAFSPDEKYFYVDNWDTERKVIMRYEVQADGTLTQGKVFFDMKISRRRRCARWHKSRCRGESLRFWPGRLVDHLSRREAPRNNCRIGASAQFCVGRRRREDTISLRQDRTISDTAKDTRNLVAHI